VCEKTLIFNSREVPLFVRKSPEDEKEKSMGPFSCRKQFKKTFKAKSITREKSRMVNMKPEFHRNIA